MGEIDFVHRIGRLGVRDAEQMPLPFAVNEAMIVDVPFFLLADAGIVNFHELARLDQRFGRRFLGFLGMERRSENGENESIDGDSAHGLFSLDESQRFLLMFTLKVILKSEKNHGDPDARHSYSAPQNLRRFCLRIR